MTAWTAFEASVWPALRRLWRQLTGQGQLTIRQELELFLGPDFDQLETHDKTYPGYDLVSLSRALASLFEECCTEYKEVGASGTVTLGQLFDFVKQPYGRGRKATAPTFERVPVDLDEEASIVTNCLSLAVLRPEAGRHHRSRSASLRDGDGTETKPAPGPEKVAVLLSVTRYAHESWDGMETQQVPRQQLTISIACRNRDVADRCFVELEERRKRLSVFRGKVIDPVVSPGGIHTIGFRAIQKVREQDLILPERVKTLIHSSILGFYNHREILEGLGIEMKRGILFHSPPGTGKTSICLYMASRLPNFTVCFVSGERLLYPREVCRMARYLQPAMIVFEDIDLVAHERNANGLATVLGELMNQIDGCEPTDQVLFIMNTNSLERLEHAVKNRPGRVDQIIQIPLPDRDARRRLIEHFARNIALAVDDWRSVEDATDGTTPAMLKEIVKRAVVGAIERNGSGKETPLRITGDDLLLATEQVRTLRDPELIPGSFGFQGELKG